MFSFTLSQKSPIHRVYSRHMSNEVLSLQETADLLGKSTQTVRRMIKKGELQAQRIRTPQGFEYGIYREYVAARLPGQMAAHLGVQLPGQPAYQATGQAAIQTPYQMTSHQPVVMLDEAAAQEEMESFLENDFYVLEARESQEEIHHRETMMLIHILERLQAELSAERAKPKSFFGWLFEKWGL